jgi:hypothetical protein
MFTKVYLKDSDGRMTGDPFVIEYSEDELNARGSVRAIMAERFPGQDYGSIPTPLTTHSQHEAYHDHLAGRPYAWECDKW